jgi:hypothetical protein
MTKQESAHKQVVCEKEIELGHKDITTFISTKGFPQ